MWMLACLAVAIVGIWRAQRRSGMTWAEFGIIRGAGFYARMWHRWSTNNHNPLPATGPAVVFCNHTCSADPTFILAICRRPISFLVAREFYYAHPVITWVLDTLHCIPVQRGGNDPVALRKALRRLQAGGLVALFPEGNLSGVGRNRLSRPKAGAALLALHSDAPVIPAFIRGGPRTEQLLDSWLFPIWKAAHIRFGAPIDLSQVRYHDRDRRVVEKVLEQLMTRITALGRANV